MSYLQDSISLAYKSQYYLLNHIYIGFFSARKDGRIQVRPQWECLVVKISAILNFIFVVLSGTTFFLHTSGITTTPSQTMLSAAMFSLHAFTFCLSSAIANHELDPTHGQIINSIVQDKVRGSPLTFTILTMSMAIITGFRRGYIFRQQNDLMGPQVLYRGLPILLHFRFSYLYPAWLHDSMQSAISSGPLRSWILP